jgi:putative transcriptional regulator
MVIRETTVFTKQVKQLLDAESYRLLQLRLVADPEAGALIPGTGGLRKIRWQGSGKGKRGGIRAIYYWAGQVDVILMPHPGAEEDSSRPGPGGIQMREELFNELVESVKEGGAILRGAAEASRETPFEDPEVGKIRAEYGLSQAKFAALLGISVRTLQNWEQGRRHPQGPARVLLRVAARHPRAILDTVKS